MRVLPDKINVAIDDALGTMIFETGPLAQLWRETGDFIPEKAEREQAHMLFWMLGLALEHGVGWRAEAAKEIERRIAIIKAAAEVLA